MKISAVGGKNGEISTAEQSRRPGHLEATMSLGIWPGHAEKRLKGPQAC